MPCGLPESILSGPLVSDSLRIPKLIKWAKRLRSILHFSYHAKTVLNQDGRSLQTEVQNAEEEAWASTISVVNEIKGPLEMSIKEANYKEDLIRKVKNSVKRRTNVPCVD